jgi:hypothetical protein
MPSACARSAVHFLLFLSSVPSGLFLRVLATLLLFRWTYR